MLEWPIPSRSKNARLMTYFFFRQAVLFSFSLLVLALHLSPGYALRPQRFHQASDPIRGLFGTSIGDIVWSGRYLWVGTESGVARLDPALSNGLNSTDWVTFTELNGLGRGAISALDAVGDTVWVATLVDSVTAEQGVNQAGTGLSFSHDGGDSWHHIPNEFIFDPPRPVLSAASAAARPSTMLVLTSPSTGRPCTPPFSLAPPCVRSTKAALGNPSCPAAQTRLVFFASDTAADSLRMVADSLASADADPDDIALLRADADSLASQSFLHRTFAVIAHGDTVWIGTSSGIAFTFDGGQHWQNAKVRLGAEGTPLPGHPAGNWVVALERQTLPRRHHGHLGGHQHHSIARPNPSHQRQPRPRPDLGPHWADFCLGLCFYPQFCLGRHRPRADSQPRPNPADRFRTGLGHHSTSSMDSP